MLHIRIFICFCRPLIGLTTKKVYGTINYDVYILYCYIGWILAAFFYGYLLTQIPGGWLAQRFGGKWVFGVGVVMTSVFTLFTPLAALSSVEFLIAVRVLEGFFEVGTLLCETTVESLYKDTLN